MTETEQFFAQLTWGRLEKRIAHALQNPKEEVPLQIPCPAVLDLAKMVVGEIGQSVVKHPGEKTTPKEFFEYSQKVGVLRILEAIICEYEDWKKVGPRIEAGRGPTQMGIDPVRDPRKALDLDKILRLGVDPLKRGGDDAGTGE